MTGSVIRLAVFDVDGVLTDGTFVPGGEETELRAFHVHDGLGLQLLREASIAVWFLTARTSHIVARRAKDLGIDGLVQGRADKLEALVEIASAAGANRIETAYMGDDLIDIPAMRWAGCSAAPADARPEAREAATWVAGSNGGRGAAREFCEYLLKARGSWDLVMARLLR
ncbi:MAG: KdsC family phosphatase [Planctomycetaceae bacterium]